ncbi:elongation factor Ts [Patescibacteria group bacterium]|nr:elongation factor Ts [Patescibacteria group bacterium]
MIEVIKKIRQETGVSLALCKKALEEAGQDAEKAKELLRKWGQELASKRSGRGTSQGIIEAYIHANKKIGVLIDLRCETDFVARNKDFQELAHEIALHTAAMNPLYLSAEDIPAEVIEKEKEVYRAQMAKEKKPKEIMEKIIEGKLDKFRKENCLLLQPYVKDADKTIQDLINDNIAKIGENIILARFIRFER